LYFNYSRNLFYQINWIEQISRASDKDLRHELAFYKYEWNYEPRCTWCGRHDAIIACNLSDCRQARDESY